MRAEFQKSYLLRYLCLASVCTGLGLWFAYDGIIGYPRQLERAEAFEELSEKVPSRELEDSWRELTAQRNWSAALPKKKAEEIRSSITGQYFWSFLNFVVGIPAIVLYIRSRGSWVELTSDGVKTSWGQSMEFSAVQSLDKKRWEKKGIAKATYKDGESTRIFTFDDFKYEREPLGKMLVALEQTLTPDKIVGGPPEAAVLASHEPDGTQAH